METVQFIFIWMDLPNIHSFYLIFWGRKIVDRWLNWKSGHRVPLKSEIFRILFRFLIFFFAFPFIFSFFLGIFIHFLYILKQNVRKKIFSRKKYSIKTDVPIKKPGVLSNLTQYRNHWFAFEIKYRLRPFEFSLYTIVYVTFPVTHFNSIWKEKSMIT